MKFFAKVLGTYFNQNLRGIRAVKKQKVCNSGVSLKYEISALTAQNLRSVSTALLPLSRKSIQLAEICPNVPQILRNVPLLLLLLLAETLWRSPCNCSPPKCTKNVKIIKFEVNEMYVKFWITQSKKKRIFQWKIKYFYFITENRPGMIWKTLKPHTHIPNKRRMNTIVCLKPALHLNANANNACGREVKQNVWYIRTLFGIRRGSQSTLHKRIVCEFPLMYRQPTDSVVHRMFVAQPNAVCLALVTRLHWMMALFSHATFTFVFRCKPGFKWVYVDGTEKAN